MECPFRAYLYFYCGLKDPGAPHENLVWGSVMHKGLEHLIRGDSLHDSMTAMYNYYNEEYGRHPEEIIYTCFEMLKLYPVPALSAPLTEHKLHASITLPSSREIVVRGMADVVIPGSFLCDHKCKGRIYPAETAQELADDHQMNLYSYILRTPQWQYDLIQCPLVAYGCPTRRPGQSAEAFAHHIFHTYENFKYFWPISKFRGTWLCCIPHYQPLLAIDMYWRRTLSPLMERFCDWWDYITSPSFNPNDPTCYNSLFYQSPGRVFDPAKTDKYAGNFHGVINGLMDYSELLHVPSYYAELE